MTLTFTQSESDTFDPDREETRLRRPYTEPILMLWYVCAYGYESTIHRKSHFLQKFNERQNHFEDIGGYLADRT